MKDFIYGLYQNDNFTLILVIALVVLIIAFVVVYFFGKKDQKLEETKRLQKIELDAFKQEEKVPEKVEVKEELKKEDEVKETINEDVNVTEFIPDVKEKIEEEEEVNIPLKKEEEVKPLFKDHEEEEKPISINELSSDLEDEKLENDLSSLESIKNEFNSINIPEVKEEIEKPVFKPSPQIFSSVFVDKKEENIVSNNEEEHITEIKKEQKPMDAKLFSIIDDEDEEDIELPSLKNEEVTNDLDKINGEVYNLK